MDNKPYEEEQDDWPLQPEPHGEWDEMIYECSKDPEEAAKKLIKIDRENKNLNRQLAQIRQKVHRS